MNTILKKSISIATCIALLVSVFAVFSPIKANAASTSDTPFNYVVLGDGAATGYGMSDQTGYQKIVEGSYPALIRDEIAKNKFEVNLDQLAMKGMRVEELRFLLDDSYAGDAYLKDTFPDLAKYREEYQAKIKKADLITYALGAVDFGSYLLYLFSDPENNMNDDEVKALAAADAQGIKASLNDVINAELNKLPNLVKSPAQSAVNDMAGTYIDALVYGYYSFCLNYDKTLALIKEINPEADVIVLGVNNMLGNLVVGGSIKAGGKNQNITNIEVGKIYKEQLIDKANLYMKNASPKYGFIDAGKYERFLDEAASYSSTVSQQMKDYFDKYEDDILLAGDLNKQMAKYLSSNRAKGITAAYDSAAKMLKDMASIDSVSVELNASVSTLANADERDAAIAQRKETYKDMGKKILKSLKSKSLEFANNVAAQPSYSYDSKLKTFISDELYRPVAASTKPADKKEAYSIGRLIMAIGVRAQMGDGFFQQPSAKGHVQIKDAVLDAYKDKYLHIDTSLEPTCTTAGVKTEFWQNVVSGKCYSDAAYTQEVNKDDYVIPALGHDWGAQFIYQKAAFCKDGIRRQVCSRCNAVKDTAITGLGPAKTKLLKLLKAKKAITVKWKKPSSANLKKTTGYQIRYSLKKSMKDAKTVFVTKNKTVSKKITKLKAKKKYFVQVRTYKLSGGKKYYSAWSNKKSVKTK